MAVQAVPTKGNLMNTKKSLALAKNGYELLEQAAKQLGTTPEALLDRIASGELTRSLSAEQQRELSALMADPSRLRSLLDRPEIRSLLK